MRKNMKKKQRFLEVLQRCLFLEKNFRNQLLEKAELTSTQFFLLTLIKKHGVISQKELVFRYKLSQEGLYYTVTKMEKKNLIQKFPSKEDPKNILLEPTKNGLKKARQAENYLAQMENTMLFHFTETEKVYLIAYLNRINRNLSTPNDFF